MKKIFNIFDDDSAQMILITCVSIVLALVLIVVYEFSALETGEQSINRENMDSFYYYKNIRDRYVDVHKYPSSTDISVFEKELKEFAILHGYSVYFESGVMQIKIIFVDKDLRIEEIIEI